MKRESNVCRSEGDLEFDIEMCLPRHRHDVGEFAHQPATATTTRVYVKDSSEGVGVGVSKVALLGMQHLLHFH